MDENLSFKVKSAPKKPGVYIFKNSQGEIIYVGKAKNLFKRVSSYFQKEHQDYKTKQLVSKIDMVDFTVTENEIEALILELNLIKKNKPFYNIEFKDDKSYPYIAITTSDEFPRLYATREHHRKGIRYFGPYVNNLAMKQTVDALRSIFKIRSCRGIKAGKPNHKTIINGKSAYIPCLNYHIEKCLAPCSEKISAEDYRKVVNDVIDFLEGRGNRIVKSLESEMKDAAKNKQFERAARFRDSVLAAKIILNKQNVEDESGDDIDIFGIALKDGYFAIALFMMRGGKLIGSESYEMKEMAESQPLLSFIEQYYFSTSYVPKEILIADEQDDVDVLAKWLQEEKGSRVEVKRPIRGQKKRLVELATKNAKHNLDYHLKKLQVESEKAMKALKQLKDALSINMPYRIECYDISNISGQLAVGSMVVFENAKAKKEHYRKFKVKYDKGSNDYEMLAEVLRRRLSGLDKEREDPSFKLVPDLIIIDGGKGQLSVTKKVLDCYFGDGSLIKKDGSSTKEQLNDLRQRTVPDLVSLAKREEELFVTWSSAPVILPKDSEAIKLVQSIRDEAHRFAIEYHRNIRSKKMLESALDNVKGVGDKRKKILINKFGSVEEIKKLDFTKLSGETGFTQDFSKKILAYLNK